MWVQFSGMKKLEESIKPGNYKTLWIAGQSVELINDVLPCSEIIARMKKETEMAYQNMGNLMQ
jgi:nitronate monooxygenase